MMPLLITALLLLAGVMVVYVIHVIKERHRADEATEIVRRMVDGMVKGHVPDFIMKLILWHLYWGLMPMRSFRQRFS